MIEFTEDQLQEDRPATLIDDTLVWASGLEMDVKGMSVDEVHEFQSLPTYAVIAIADLEGDAAAKGAQGVTDGTAEKS